MSTHMTKIWFDGEKIVTQEILEQDMITEKTTRPLTFGEKAVGITFNPSQDLKVEGIKRRCADLIDEIHKLRTYQADLEVARMASIAITDIQSAQMWAVKAATWKHEE